MSLYTEESALRESVAMTLKNMSNSFGKEIKLTLVARHQGDPNAFMVFSEEQDLEKVIETLQHNLVKNRNKPSSIIIPQG